MFAGVPLKQHFTPLGPDLVRQVHRESPSGNTINDIHDHSGAQQLGVKVDNGLDLMQGLPSAWTGSEQWDITHHQCACFLEYPSAKCPSEAIGAAYKYH